jgi:hypothetical protein
MEQTVKTYKSLEEIYKYFLPSTTESQKQDRNDPETIWKSVEKEVLAKLKSKAQFDRK